MAKNVIYNGIEFQNMPTIIRFTLQKKPMLTSMAGNIKLSILIITGAPRCMFCTPIQTTGAIN